MLVLVFIEPLAFATFTRNPFVIKETVFALGLLGLAWAALSRAGRAEQSLPPAAISASLLGLVACHAILVATSTDWVHSVAHLARLLGGAVFFLLIAARSWSTGFMHRLLRVLAAGVALTSLYGVLQHLRLDPVPWGDTFRPAGAPLSSVRVFATFGHPNFFGPHLAMALPLMVALGMLARRRSEQLAVTLGISLAVYSLLLTGNRGAWVGVLVAALAGTLLAWGLPRQGWAAQKIPADRPATLRTKVFLLVGVIAAAAVLALATSSLVRVRLMPTRIMEDPTVLSRGLIWSGTLRMIGERPLLGWGAGTFAKHFPAFRPARLAEFHDELTPVTHAHNEYLEVLAESGAVGFVAWAAFLLAAVRCACRRAALARSREDRIVMIALMTGTASMLASALFGVEMRQMNASLFLWLLLGFLICQPADSALPDASAAARRPLPALFAGVVVVGAVIFAALSVRVLVADVLLQRAEKNLARGTTAATTAAALGRSAYDWNPTSTAGLMLAAEALMSVKDHAGAREIYRQVERVNPTEPLLDYDLALTDSLLGEDRAALARVERAYRIAPGHAPTASLYYDLLLRKALELTRAGDYSAARQAIDAAGLLVPKATRAIFLLGNLFVLQEKYGAAVNRYRRALELEPDYLPASENLKRVEEFLAARTAASPPGMPSEPVRSKSVPPLR